MQTSLSHWVKNTATSKTNLQISSTSVAKASIRSPVVPLENGAKAATKTANDKTSDILRANGALNAAPSLHPQITFSHLSSIHVPQFRRINNLLLQIPYQNAFYDAIISDPVTASISVVALWHEDDASHGSGSVPKVIGGIRCRLLTASSSGLDRAIASTFPPKSAAEQGGEAMLYISALTLLSPYRRLGIAGRLLELVEQAANEKYNATSVGAHVWIANDEGLEWYGKRGFREVGREDDYYQRLTPMGAVVMRKEIDSRKDKG